MSYVKIQNATSYKKFTPTFGDIEFEIGRLMSIDVGLSRYIS